MYFYGLLFLQKEGIVVAAQDAEFKLGLQGWVVLAVVVAKSE